MCLFVVSSITLSSETMHQTHNPSLLYVIDEAMKRYIIPHHVYIGSHLTYLYAFNGCQYVNEAGES